MKITHNKVGQNLNLSDTGRSEKKKSDSILSSSERSNSSSGASGSLGSSGALGVSGVSGSSSSPVPATAKRFESAAQVSLSPRSQDLKRAMDLVKSVPDSDAEKISSLQKAIDEGTYKINPKAIADRLVDEELSFSQLGF